MKIKINEIYCSIQGEAKYSGILTTFVRLTGCNLRCFYCDTKYAYYKGTWLSIQDIINAVKKYPAKYITITGGEPLLQRATPILVAALLDEGFKVILETNGTLDLSLIDWRTILSIDVKTPSADKNAKFLVSNLRFLKEQDQLKFVISNDKDYIWSKNFIKKYLKNIPCDIWMTSAYNFYNYQVLAEKIIKDNLCVKFYIQIHKFIWENKKEGIL